MSKQKNNTKLYVILGVVALVVATVFLAKPISKKYNKWVQGQIDERLKDIKSEISDLRHDIKKDSVRYAEALETLKERNVVLLQVVDSLKLKRKSGEKKIIEYTGDFNERFSKFAELTRTN